MRNGNSPSIGRLDAQTLSINHQHNHHHIEIGSSCSRCSKQSTKTHALGPFGAKNRGKRESKSCDEVEDVNEILLCSYVHVSLEATDGCMYGGTDANSEEFDDDS